MLKKTRVLVTVLIVTVMVVCMCGMVFGYNYTRYFMPEVTVTSSKVQLAGDTFTASVSKKCVLSPYYHSITTDGSYKVILYDRPNDNTRVYYDDAERTIRATTTAGFYTSNIYVEADNNYEPGMRCTDTSMYLDYLRVLFD